MDDATKAELMKRTREWLQSCVNAATRSGVPEEADLEAFILAHLDGEPERLAAAREEQREADAKFCPNCLGVGFVERPVPCPYCDDSTHDHYCPTGTQRQQCGCGAERIRATPLTATPLADRLAAAEARVKDLERAEKTLDAVCWVLGREVGNRGDSEGAVDVAERIIRERDEAVAALRALLPEVYGTRSPQTVGYAIDHHRIIAQARDVLAKYPEGK